jgi:hypothetical protein
MEESPRGNEVLVTRTGLIAYLGTFRLTATRSLLNFA